MNRQQTRPRNWQPLQRATSIPKTPAERREMVRHIRATFSEVEPEAIDALLDDAASELSEVWRSDRYQVHVIRWHGAGPKGCDIVQLSVKRLDRAAVHDWRDLQRIKNQLVGVECEAIELYPAESRLVDTANQYHLWAVDDPTYRWPIGYVDRAVTGESGGGTVQRPLDAEDQP